MIGFVKGLVIGAIVAFPLGMNFGKDEPLFSNPFTVKADISERIVEQSGRLLRETKSAIHEATKPPKR
ncbi:MAG: hypothetical protein OES46_20010 [Gammaproteobacteria bacterium]|jgi:hypothetical protein|nr:hypothetical protein [Gammaproteobacteria bacterium]